MSNLSFVYFDLDDTLLDHKQAERQALEDLYDQYRGCLGSNGLSSLQDMYAEINADVWKRYGAGEIDKVRAKLERFELLLARLGLDDASDAGELSAFYLSRYSNHWSFLPGASEAYQSIANRLPVGILTNGFIEIQHAKLRQFPEIERAARAIVISEEVGYLKPDPKIFDHATKLADCAREEILFVGDSLRSDVLGGLRAGWRVAWFTQAEDGPRDAFRFCSWDQLLDRIATRRKSS